MLRATVFPVPGGSFTDTWGAARGGGRKHEGVDIFAPYGSPILAPVDGVITKAGGDGGRGGLRVWVNGRYYAAHMSKIAVKKGQQVKAGQVIGYVGTSGDALGTPPHVHWGEMVDGKWVNAFETLQRWKQGRAALEPQAPVAAAPAATLPPDATVAPAELEFGQGVPTGPPMPGLPGPELPGSSEIPFRDTDTPSSLWQLISPQSQEGRRILDLATAGEQ